MILTYFSVFFTLFKAWFLYVFKIKNSNPALYHSAVYLFSKQSFRLPQSARTDPFIILRTFFAFLREIFARQPLLQKLNDKPVAAFDSYFNAVQRRVEYLRYFKVEPGLFLSRVDLFGSFNILQGLVHLFAALILFPFLILFSFSSHRANYALFFRVIPEWISLIRLLKEHRIKRIYHFCIYEHDANFITYLLSKRGILTSKIPSEVPLMFANKTIVADELCLCFAYQKEEVKKFKDTMFVNKISQWLPEMQITYLHHYTGRNLETPVNRIGFYSSAFWLRKKLGHSIADVGSYDAEEELLRYIADYLKKNKDIRLTMFTHPYEKKTVQLFEETKQYYATIFGKELEERMEYTGMEEKSTETFDRVNIGISVFSTIMFERISLGFKTLLAPLDKKDFPIEESPFRNICAYTKEQLFEKLDAGLVLSNEEFFKMNGISSYKAV